MNVKKEARRDAHEYARAEMAYGEGAGTRRKLIAASTHHKAVTIPGYQEEFLTALDHEDYAEHAERARKERHRKDVVKKVDRNARGLITGNRQNLTTAVWIVTTVGVVMHQTGLDKELWVYTKKKYVKVKSWAKVKRAVIKKKIDAL